LYCECESISAFFHFAKDKAERKDVRVMSIEDEVREASKKFYTGLNSMANGNSAPLADIWLQSGEVTTMHPIGGMEEGWTAVKASFEGVAKLASEGCIELKDQFIRVVGGLAYELGTEKGEFLLAGEKVTIEQRVTNIYEYQGGAWKMVHHHTDISPAMIAVLKRLQAKAA
jgi:ketosteroid isomerase-like protein